MSRVRIYELAKEAGMSSKALADKLIDQGYDIKGHSSTVDDETAENIRKTVLKESNTEMVEKRISASEGPTVIRRRSTVIRRRPQAKPEAEVPEEEYADEPAPADTESVVAETVEDLAAGQVMETEAPVTPAEHVTEEEVSAESATPSDSAESPSQDTEVREDESVSEDVPVGEDKVETAVIDEVPEVEQVETPQPVETVIKEANEATPKKDDTVVVASQKEKPEEKKVKPKTITPPPRKGMARVVGTIELPKSNTESTPSRPRKKHNKPSPARKVGRPAPGGVGGAAAAPAAPTSEDASRGKKRGKRGKSADEADRSRRPAGKGKKGKNVKFTHFGDDYQRGHGGKRGKRGKQKVERNIAQVAEMKASKRRITVYDTISVADLAARMSVKASEVIAKLMGLGVMATINQTVDVDTAMIIAADFGYEVEQGITEEIGIQMLDESQEGGEMVQRPPVVTVMGHVDHGKTSILDAIRKTDVAEGEAGGITQHIGAYHVRSSAGDVTFVDTPGHAAFTEMRSRGAQVTDLVILVVAADDGVMEQTREAIRHAQAADVPIIVAVNKIDKDNSDPDRVKRELADFELIPEDWGGQTMFCETSAKNNIGIDELMESIQLMAEVLELKADKKRQAKGRVIEAKLDKGRGAVATVLIQEGTLKVGEHFVVGRHAGKVRAMLDERGRSVKSAGPSIPVEVQGLSGVPQAGDEFIVVTDERMAKNVSQVRATKAREVELGANSKISLDKLFEKMSEGDVQELRVVIRSDVQGTLEAFAKAAEELSTKDIKVRVLHEGTGTITESDILLASASEAIIIGFNVRPSVKVKELASKENVDVRSYDVIYHALDDIRKAMVGMLEPTFEEDVIGTAEVRETFGVPKVGTIAGCGVLDGKIQRNAGVRVLREGVVVYTGKISSLRRFKDDVKEVASGYECGIGVENFNDIKVGDHLEAFVMLEVEATLE
ncbi:translation initiation factor IF-2 [Desulfopila sp. IMCC35008]|uniref:translation initiation factor IF-2 n=1 Tax=Desulfopila sp. IMCC35008 TaxID=2653858 RepID=UPI0013D7A3DE|nr:translation initiation factor IF-2 [Desulfopila sp. IMCC35008]